MRSFVIRNPTVLTLDATSTASAGRIQLWQEELDRPVRSILQAPVLFQTSLKRSAARIFFMREKEHVMTPSATELLLTPANFCQKLGASESEYATWQREWLLTPMGLRYGH